ncbi:MAG: hypothetical protein LWX83_12730 [Anaerolineae bacterium]|nr:hypothetical protein [Anaerolineae bacterium]
MTNTMTMTLIALVVTLAIFFVVLIVITRPLYSAHADNINEARLKKDVLNREYQQTLNRIRELEQEHLEGKLGDSDYQDRRAFLNNEAVNLLKQLESDPAGKL